MNNTIVKNSNAWAIFFLSTLSSVLIGFLGGFFSNAFFNSHLYSWLMVLIYALVYFFAGFSLFCIILSRVFCRNTYLIKNWSIVLWCISFAMLFISPFLFGTLGYIWLSMLSAIIAGLVILQFKLSFFGAISQSVVLGYVFYMCYVIIISLA